jgi:phosphohistidine phosphatase SixA
VAAARRGAAQRLAIATRLSSEPPPANSKILVVGHAVLLQALTLKMLPENDMAGRQSLCQTPFRPAEIMVVDHSKYLGTIYFDGCRDPL